MAKTNLGSKRIDPETGRKFYDLNKDPIVSPYTGKSYPRSYFESAADNSPEEEEEVEEVEADAPEVVSLEDAEEEATTGETLPDIEGEDDVELDDDEDQDAFLETEEEEDDDVSAIIGGGEDDDDT